MERGSPEGEIICWPILARSVVQLGSARLHGDNHQWLLVGMHRTHLVHFTACDTCSIMYFILNEL